MLDDKKIEEAALDYCAKCTDTTNRNIDLDKDECVDLYNGFKEGAHWAINEFLKNLWHSYDEVPTRKDKDILLFLESYSADSEDDYDEYFELAHTREGFTQETWEDFMNIGGTPSNWLYIDDLFPKKGGENEKE